MDRVRQNPVFVMPQDQAISSPWQLQELEQVQHIQPQAPERSTSEEDAARLLYAHPSLPRARICAACGNAAACAGVRVPRPTARRYRHCP